MAIFEDELITNNPVEGDPIPQLALGTPQLSAMPTLPNLGGGGSANKSIEGLDGSQLSKIAKLPGQGGGANLIPLSEVVANKRYNTYVRGMDLENIYGMQQSTWSQLGNSVVKMAGLGVGTFVQGFATIPNTISALKNGKFADLSGGPDSYEAAIDDWTKNLEDYFPNYYTRKEKESPFLAMVPFMPGSANFWGDKIIKNLGFTAGAIGSALVQDAIVGAVTEGVGAAPLLASQLGKASLWLNKLYAGSTKVDRVLDLASAVGKTEKQILNIKRLGEIAAGTKVTNGFRYATGIYGSSRTEAAIEARDSYRQVKDELIKEYKSQNPGKEPFGADLAEIESYATDAMNTRFGINMALLTASNTIQFGNLFKSFTSAQKGLSGELTRHLEDAGKIGLQKGSLDVFEKKTAETIGGRVWDSVRPKIANILAEGVYEEGGQYAAEKGTYDYFTRKYRNLSNPLYKDNWNTTVEAVDSTVKGLKDQFGTSEGLENMIVGAISAMISGGIMGRIDKAKGGGADARLTSTINTLNQYGLTGILSNQFDNTLTSAGIAAEMDQAAKSGDVFKYKNLKDDLFFDYVSSRLPSGMHDVTIEQLNMLKDLDKEEFEKTFGMDFNSSNKSTVSEYVGALVDQANDIKKTYDSIDATFKNPFNASSDTINYNIFNGWKKELAYNASKIPSIQERLDSIQQSVSEINPQVTNDLLSQLTNKESLRDLSKSYEERASQLNKTITEFTTPADSRKIKDQVKALRTASEKINIGLSTQVDIKLFDYLLNFELNNQEPTDNKVVSPEWSNDLFNYGHDINRHNVLKTTVSKLFDNLSSQAGFEKYFEQALQGEVVPDTPPTIEQEVTSGIPVSTFKNKVGEDEPVQVGREYQIPASKKARVDKIDEDRWQVTSPDGNITFYPSKEKADAIADDLNEEFGSLQKVKVIAINPDGTVKIEDINGDIYSIETSKLGGYERIQSEQEKLQKFSEDIENSQKEIESKSGTVSTSPLPTDLNAIVKEDPKRSLANLFTGTTGTSENDPAKLKAHEIRSAALRNNAKSFPNRQALRIILVTQNQEKSLGLDGLANLSMGSVGTHTDVDNGLVAAVYVEQDKNDVYFINEKGERIGKLNEPVDINKVVFDSMPTTSLINRFNKETRYRATDGEAAAKEEAARWKAKRQQLFENKGKPESYKFTISRGIADVIDLYARNPVGKTMIDESLIATQEGLVVISTTGTISHQGEDIKFPVGRPVFQYGDTLQFLSNKMFNKDEAEAIFEVMKFMSQSINKQLAAGRKVKIDADYATFLQNVLYWRKSSDTSGNQIFVDTATMEFFFNNQRYDLTKIEDSKNDIVDRLQKVYNNVNNTTLTKSFSEPFSEYYLDNGALKIREWNNYQSYLLSSKNPDGSARSSNNIPLASSVREKNDLKPYNFKSKYSILEGMELPQVVVKPAVVAPAPIVTPAPVTPAAAPAISDEQKVIDFIGKRIQLSLPEGTVSDGSPQTYKGLNAGEVVYTVTPEGQVAIDGTNPTNLATIKTVVNTPASMAAVNAALAPTPAPVVTPPAPIQQAAPVSTDAKADIERDAQGNFIPKKYTLNARGENPAPNISASAIKDESFGGDKPTNIKQVKLLEIRGRNSNGVTVGKVWIQLETGESFDAEVLFNDAELAALEGAKPAEETKPTVPTATEVAKTYWESSTPESVKKELIEDTSKSITSDITEPGYTVQFSEYQNEDRIEQVMVGGFEDYDEIDEVEFPKGNYFTVTDGFGSSESLHENNPRLNQIIGDVIAYNKKLENPTSPKKKKTIKNAKLSPDKEHMKVARGEESSGRKLTDLEIQIFKEWHAQNAANIPYRILENLVKINETEKAWGVYEKGFAKFYKGGLSATPYHELFHPIWKHFLSEDERQVLRDEFRAKKGQFTERSTGKKIDYSEATDNQIEERIADDFGEFRVGKLPARSIGEMLLRFFKNMIEFFKSFVSKPSKKEELFKAINSGKYKEKKLPKIAKKDRPQYQPVGALTEEQSYEFVQDIAARWFQIVFGTNRNLFDIESLSVNDIFQEIKDDYVDREIIDDADPDSLTTDEFNQLVGRTKEFLRLFKIEFTEDDSFSINDERRDKNEYTREAFTTNWKSSSPFAIKLLMGTLSETDPTNGENENLDLPKLKTNYFGGYKLLDFSRTFATAIDKFANTTKVTDLVNKLFDLASSDSNYVRLFTRLGGSRKSKTIDFSQFKSHDWRLFVNFYQTFTRQKPDAVIQYITDGNVYSSSANLFTSIKQVKRSWIERMRALAKDSESILSYNSDTKTIQVKNIKDLPIRSTQNKIDFLAKLGIDFPIEAYGRLKTREQDNQVKQFGDAVSAIRTYLGSEEDIMSISGKTLTVDAQFNTLAELLIKVTNPNQDVSYFGIDKKRIQAYADNNAVSVFENMFNSAATLDDLVNNIRPELQDVFSKNSAILKKGGLFFDKNGKRIRKLKVQYIQGTNKVSDKKEITTSKLSLGDRFVQEMNQNINGSYYVLVPADSSTEWMMNMGNNIKFSDIQSEKASSKIHDIFMGYLEDDIAIARENRTNLKNVAPRAKELRFFKDILPPALLEKFDTLLAISDSTNEDFKKLIKDNEDAINSAVDAYIQNSVDNTIKVLKDSYQIINTGVDKKGNAIYSFSNLDDDFSKKEDLNKRKLDEFELNDIVTFTNVNYIINNIEYHKVFFGDPYQFAVKDGQLDETKRIKSFLSPRRTTFDTPEFNTFLNTDMNKAGDIKLTSADPGYHLHKSYAKTVTLSDVEIVGSIATLKNIPEEIKKKYEKKAKETDGASWIMDTTYREVKLKNGQWTDAAEDWHQWQMAYTRQNMPGYKYTDEALKNQDAKLVSKPMPVFMVDVLKPIVSGNIDNTNKIQLVLDKFSQMPIYYSMVQGTNLENQYVKMFNEKVQYAVVLSGRKVGADKTHDVYLPGGAFNNAPYSKDTIVNVPWTSYGLQVENAYEGPKEQTRGSQITKLASIDLFDNGNASDEAKKEYARNNKLLKLMHENGYKSLLKKLGIQDLGDSFSLPNNINVAKTLEYETLRREMSTNVKDTVKLDKNKQFRIPFEASTAYIQIRDILFSMVDKAIVSPKVSGGAHVQVPVTMWENMGNREIVYKSSDGWKKISQEQYNKLTEDEKKKVAVTDTTLKFYTREEPYCEILLPHWFGEKFKSKFKTEKELIAYLNKPENASILRGIGFRIPTQSLSSIEVFRVKGFLPKSMGSTVVVPSEIVTKAGSDFDIDKLNMYLKATYIDKNGDLRLVEYKGSEESTKDFYGGVFDDVLAGKKLKKAELFEAVDILTHTLPDPNNLLDKYGALIDIMMEDYQQSEDLAADLMKDMEKLGDSEFQSELRDKFVDDMYKKSLENEYYDSLEKLITLPENFDRLISPVDDAGLEDVSKELDKLTNADESSIPNRILNRNYMTTLRHSFITAKKWVGIAAVNITGQSLTQKSEVGIDTDKFKNLSATDRKFLGDGSVALPHNTTTDGRVSISGRKTNDGKHYISDRLSGYATAFVDVAKNPYIMKIIKSDLVVGTFMFLERIGAGETTAFFLNQPIISDYLNYLDSINAKSLFGKANIEFIRGEYGGESAGQFDVSALKENIKKGKEKADQAEQVAIFDEFLKYTKMAEFSFKLTQASNYDTTSFRSSGALYKKQLRTEVARQSNIFSSVDNILDGSFIGDQSRILAKSIEAYGTILKFDKYDFRNVINTVLKPYALDDYMSADAYSRIENKIIASFLDYIIQTKSGISSEIKSLMIDAETSVVTKLANAKRRYPELGILDRIDIEGSSVMEGGAKTVKLVVNNKEAYDEDVHIGMFRELRDYNTETNSLYNDIVKLAILQGTYQSSVSIKNVIPIEDYSAIVAPIIAPLVVNEDVKSFADGYFQRNNFKDSDVWKVVHPKFFVAKSPQQDIEDVQPVAQDAFGNDIYQYVNTTAFPSIPLLKNKSSERKILILNETFNYLDTQEDFIIVPRVVIDRKTGVKVDMFTGRTVTDSMISAANKKGNQIYKSVYGYQKVKHMDGTPVTFTSVYKGEDMVNHVYKLINLHGDNPYTTEYYPDFRPSALNNNTMKIDSEIPNNDIIDHFAPQLAEDMAKSIGEAVPSQPMEQAPATVSSEKINIYAGTGENAELSNFASRPFEDKTEWQGLTFKSVEGAFQAAKIQLSDMFDKNDNLTKEGDELLNKLQEASGAEAKALGRKVTGLNVKEWDRLSSNIMKGLLLESFKQNPKALQRLLATGNATLTHTQDKYKWGKEFPRLLMEVRKELKPEQAVSEYGLTAANFEGSVPDYAMAISNFYEALTPEQKIKLGSLEDIMADYESIPFEYSYDEYIESLNCKL
jgi:predicted NAD-dependent protein-ADP-ribosyltransferase YbiA (DUF1768 family)